MVSLYIHIPFCYKKCSYCNFLANPIDQLNDLEILYDKYLQGLFNHIDQISSKIKDKQVKTIYIWGWTPLVLWNERILSLIDYLNEKFDLQDLEEFSIELNPNPYDQVFDFIKTLNKKYQNWFRIRYSFGVQSFDDELLKKTWRDYYFNYLVWFLRNLYSIKWTNNIFNFDFIAFGKFNTNKSGEKQLWDSNRIKFFLDFVESGFADSFSVYTLELFPWSVWYSNSPNFTDQDIYEEFEMLKNTLLDAWYKRYELSNFALPWKSSIHNRVYWKQKPYIWLGIGASSYVTSDCFEVFWKEIKDGTNSLRFENTKSLEQYISWEYINEKSINYQTKSDDLIEGFFLGLRTDEWIKDLSNYETVLVKNYKDILADFQNQWLVELHENRLILTDEWMNVYNSIITQILEKI